ncbi:hypothetical protein AC812_09785 [Bellilinea caldifistulae]|uniref:Uncharacterized protein n=1 Tax=Bellilinea caldifistulae TaxID=360411 RepID=A0A0P6Y146_9CHLR|nr:hypothetical protein AC812_09785 [Bellilinea caldifistulae]
MGDCHLPFTEGSAGDVHLRCTERSAVQVLLTLDMTLTAFSSPRAAAGGAAISCKTVEEVLA